VKPEATWRKPEWLRKPIRPSAMAALEAQFAEAALHTVCREAACPNIGECFAKRQATFMILGSRCTRACTFCNVTRAAPLPPDPDEPRRVAEAVRSLGLRHVVVTAPTRDDLSDGGAAQFAATVKAVRALDPEIRVELLISDLREDEKALAVIAASGAEILGHNLETVPRLYHVRKGAEYARSLRVLKTLAALSPDSLTKSGIMLGLGETEEEVVKLMGDLLGVGCTLLSIGQYLSPSKRHAPVVEYVEPERFERYREIGMEMGFKYIKSSPYTRSSYMAHEYLEGS
jgi:lipoic acid synthetase